MRIGALVPILAALGLAGEAGAAPHEALAIPSPSTSTAAWANPEPPPPPSEPPIPMIRESRIAFRLQGGMTSGILQTTGGSVGLTVSLLGAGYRVELGGRYQVPRTARFGDTDLPMDVSIFEVGGRGCLEFELGRAVFPVCAGVAGGRWGATIAAFGGGEQSTADFWLGGHALLSALYPVSRWISLWVGLEGVVTLVEPEIRFTTETMAELGPFGAQRLGVAVEIGVELATF